MQSLLSEFIDMRRLPAGRASFALTKMRALFIAAAVAAPNLEARIDDALAEAKRTLHTDLRWMYTRTQTSRARGNAVEVDRELDRTLKAIHDRLKADTIGKAEDPVVQAATAIQKELFPNGLGGVTRTEFNIQLARVDTLLERLEDDFDAQVQTLGLDRHVQNLRTLNEQFRVELDHENGRPLKYSDVIAQRDLLHYAICEVVIAAFFELRDPNHAELLGKFFEPLRAQLKITREANRRRRDVNPKTGEELESDLGVEDETDTTMPQPSDA